jgi:hypothetical protein
MQNPGFTANPRFYLVEIKCKTPVSKCETPVSKCKTPVSKCKTPVSKCETPVFEVQDPGFQCKTPVSKCETPVSKCKTPLSKCETPVSKCETPVSKCKTPVFEVQDPGFSGASDSAFRSLRHPQRRRVESRVWHVYGLVARWVWVLNPACRSAIHPLVAAEPRFIDIYLHTHTHRACLRTHAFFALLSDYAARGSVSL